MRQDFRTWHAETNPGQYTTLKWHCFFIVIQRFRLFNGYKDEVEPIWLGHIVSNSEWEGQGVSQNTTSRIISYSNGVKVSKGEVAIFVIWYEKNDGMSDLLDYWVSRSETKPNVQNNRDMLPVDVGIYCMLGDINNVPKLRTSSRSSTVRAQENNQSRVEEWHDKEWGIRWRMDQKLRNAALALCTTWLIIYIIILLLVLCLCLSLLLN